MKKKKCLHPLSLLGRSLLMYLCQPPLRCYGKLVFLFHPNITLWLSRLMSLSHRRPLRCCSRLEPIWSLDSPCQYPLMIQQARVSVPPQYPPMAQNANIYGFPPSPTMLQPVGFPAQHHYSPMPTNPVFYVPSRTYYPPNEDDDTSWQSPLDGQPLPVRCRPHKWL